MPDDRTMRWFICNQIHRSLCNQERSENDRQLWNSFTAEQINDFLLSLKQEERASMLLDTVESWGKLGADPVILQTFTEMTGINV